MYKEILYSKQLDIIEILKLFNRNFYLALWTAIALQLWHRKSLDFDLFSSEKIDSTKIINKLRENKYRIDRVLIDNKNEELTLIISWVKITFLYYPFDIQTPYKFEWIKLPSINTLCAMKFYTLWRRWKWKDYVDIYSILKKFDNFQEISKIAENIFSWTYNEKLLREQLCYFQDIDYSEEVEYIWEEINKEEIKDFLCKIGIS